MWTMNEDPSLSGWGEEPMGPNCIESHSQDIYKDTPWNGEDQKLERLFAYSVPLWFLHLFRLPLSG